MRVSFEQRNALVFLATRGESSVRKIARDLGIKYTTARHILNVYKITGEVESITAIR